MSKNEKRNYRNFRLMLNPDPLHQGQEIFLRIVGDDKENTL
jgi:hypothetical protein